MKIAIICGTRPEAIKLIPVYQCIKESGLHDVLLISTGQHLEMLRQIFDLFEITPDYELGLMTQNQSLAKFTARAIESIDECISEILPDLVLVQGDTTTAMTAALVSFYHQIDVGHVEAGLRTHEKYSPFPEEINRKIISSVGDIHFAPTQLAADNLIKEGHKNVFVTGNTVIDSLLLCKGKVELNQEHYINKYQSVINTNRANILITGHRRESFGEGFQKICKAIKELAFEYPELNFIYPVHLNPNVQTVVESNLGKVDNIKLISPVPYDDLIFLMTQSKLILTDSGGIQEEAPSLNIPVIVMRDHTERQEGVDAGCAILAGTTVKNIVENVQELLTDSNLYSKMSTAKNPYGEGMASANILAHINP